MSTIKLKPKTNPYGSHLATYQGELIRKSNCNNKVPPPPHRKTNHPNEWWLRPARKDFVGLVRWTSWFDSSECRLRALVLIWRKKVIRITYLQVIRWGRTRPRRRIKRIIRLRIIRKQDRLLERLQVRNNRERRGIRCRRRLLVWWDSQKTQGCCRRRVKYSLRNLTSANLLKKC